MVMLPDGNIVTSDQMVTYDPNTNTYIPIPTELNERLPQIVDLFGVKDLKQRLQAGINRLVDADTITEWTKNGISGDRQSLILLAEILGISTSQLNDNDIPDISGAIQTVLLKPFRRNNAKRTTDMSTITRD